MDLDGESNPKRHLMKTYHTEHDRRKAGVCIKCEGSPVVSSYRCQECYDRHRSASRKLMRNVLDSSARMIWSPELGKYMSYDERESYDKVRAAAALELANGAGVLATMEKYKLSYQRLRKICVEHGVVVTRKPGCGEHVKTQEREVLEGKIVEDARAGMCLRDLKKKYPHIDVRGICHRVGAIPGKAS